MEEVVAVYQAVLIHGTMVSRFKSQGGDEQYKTANCKGIAITPELVS